MDAASLLDGQDKGVGLSDDIAAASRNNDIVSTWRSAHCRFQVGIGASTSATCHDSHDENSDKNGEDSNSASSTSNEDETQQTEGAFKP